MAMRCTSLCFLDRSMRSPWIRLPEQAGDCPSLFLSFSMWRRIVSGLWTGNGGLTAGEWVVELRPKWDGQSHHPLGRGASVDGSHNPPGSEPGLVGAATQAPLSRRLQPGKAGVSRRSPPHRLSRHTLLLSADRRYPCPTRSKLGSDAGGWVAEGERATGRPPELPLDPLLPCFGWAR